MDKDIVLKVENVSKKFTRSIKRSMFYGSNDLLRGILGKKPNTSVLRKGEFWSLHDMNFELKKGEVLGLVGANGSGKSTMLRLINGIFPPDTGTITVKGKIGALIAVGAGFHPHMTGRENIYLNGVILGMTREEIEDKFDEIIDFAEIGEFIDAPVSTYSSGMYVRLGFAIAIHSLPDIVLIDEVLAVGDAKFQRKCLDKIRELREKTETSFILVSHNMQNIESMCSKVVLMNKGQQIMVDKPRNIIPVYELLLQTGEDPNLLTPGQSISQGQTNDLEFISKYPDFGTEEISVKSIRLLDSSNNPTKQLRSLDSVTLQAEIESNKELSKSIIYLTFNIVNDKNDEGRNFTSLGIQEEVDIKKGRSTIDITIPQAQLTTGEYKVGFNIFDETFTNPYTQGYYGYFISKSDHATMLRVGQGTPFCWVTPEIKVTNFQDVQSL